MLVFSLVLLVSWFDYVSAGRTSQMRVTWEVCSTVTLWGHTHDDTDWYAQKSRGILRTSGSSADLIVASMTLTLTCNELEHAQLELLDAM